MYSNKHIIKGENKRNTGKLLLAILFFVTLFLTGCSQFQYVTVDSNLYQNKQKEFICENDTLLIRYTFTGENFPITISVFNKLQKPLYIDWSKTVVILNNEQLKDAFEGNGLSSYIAPQSNITVRSRMLHNRFFEIYPTDTTTKTRITTTEGSKQVKNTTFTPNSTPVYFRNSITFSTMADLSNSFYFDNPFWISSIYQTSSQPSDILEKQANQFFICKNNENNDHYYYSSNENHNSDLFLRWLELILLIRFAHHVEVRF
jgi:hypothetical protein